MNPNPQVILNGGKPFAVKHTNGNEERVTIRLLPIRLLQKYAETIGDVAACAELFCDKRTGWADSLEHESVFAVVEEGERLNQSPFDQLVKRQRARSVRLAKQSGMAVPEALNEVTTASPDLSAGPAS